MNKYCWPVLQFDGHHYDKAEQNIFGAIGLRAHAFRQPLVGVITQTQFVGAAIHNGPRAERDEHKGEGGCVNMRKEGRAVVRSRTLGRL